MRRDSKIRKGNIVVAALELAAELHYNRVTRVMVAERLQVPVEEIFAHFNTSLQMRTAIVRAAIAQHNLAVVGQALQSNHSLAVVAPAELRAAAWGAMK